MEKLRIWGALRSSGLLEAQDSPQELKYTWAVWVDDSWRMYTALSSMKEVFLGLFYLSFHNLMHLQKKDPIPCNEFLCTCAQHGGHHPLSCAEHSLTPRTVLCHITSVVSHVVTFLTYVSLFYAFFWVITWCLNFICQRFGTPCLFHLHRQVGIKNDWGWECWGIYTGKGLTRK